MKKGKGMEICSGIAGIFLGGSIFFRMLVTLSVLHFLILQGNVPKNGIWLLFMVLGFVLEPFWQQVTIVTGRDGGKNGKL